MFKKKVITKEAAKESVSFLARKEATVLATAVLTLATQKVLQKVVKKYPSLNFLKPKAQI
jgi:hypothetical protein